MRVTPQPTAAFRTRAVAWSIGCLGLAACGCMLARGLDASLARLDHQVGLLVDFDIYYDQARRLLAPRPSPSPHFVYPPFAGLLFLGFGRLEREAARAVWGVLQISSCAWLAWECAARMPSLRARERAGCAFGLVASSLPVLHCVKWGQLSVMVCLLGLAGLSQRGLRGATALGGAIAIKLYPASYALLHLTRGRFCALLAVAGVALALGLALPLVVFGPSATGMLLGHALAGARDVSNDLNLSYQTLQALYWKWFADPPLPGTPAPLVAALPRALLGPLAALSGIALLAITLLVARRRARRDDADALAIMVCAALLVKPGWLHYFAMLPLGQALLIERAARSSALALVCLSVALSALPAIACLLAPALFPWVQYSGAITLSALLCLFGLWRSQP